MSSEQQQIEAQLQDILMQMHANAATNTDNTSTTTEEEKANPEVFEELQAILGEMHGKADKYEVANYLLTAVAAEEETAEEDTVQMLQDLLGSMHNIDQVPTNEEEETNNYLLRKSYGEFFMSDDHQYTKKDCPLYNDTMKFIVLSKVVGITPAGSSAPPNSSAVWDKAARVLNNGETGKQLRAWWVIKGSDKKNRHYSGQYHNQIHPYLKVLGEDDVPLMQCISVLNELREELTKTCPWMKSNPALQVAFIPTNVSFDWFNQITDPEKKKVIEKVLTWRKNKSSQKMAEERLLVLELQAGLLSDWNQYSVKVHEWLHSDENEEGLLTGHIRWAFFKWAGVTDLSQWRGLKDVGVTETQIKEWFEEYKRNPIVKRFIKETDEIAKDSAKLVEDALPKLERINQHYTNRRHAKNGEKGYDNRVYVGELYDRVNNKNEEVLSTLPSGEEVPSSKDLNYEIFYQLHHDTIGDVDGRALKRETRWPDKRDGSKGAIKQPAEYTREDMDKQNPGMRLVDAYYHALVEEKRSFRHKVDLTTYLRDGMHDMLVLKHNNNRCLVNAKHVADTNNLRAFHSHHLTLGYNTKIGSSILETMKMSALGTMKQKVKSPKNYPRGHLKSMNLWYQHIENLFPELIITRLLDCRYHYLFHYLLNNPSLRKELNLEFPYEFDEKRNLMISTRTKVDDEEKEVVLKLPSVMEVLEIKGEEAEGVCRQSYGKGKRMTVGEDEDIDFGEDEDIDFGEDDSDSESELE